jgi:trehalose utilization protein
MRVLVWDEQQPEQRAVYPEFIGGAIAAHLAKQPGITARSVALDDTEQGLDPRVLDETDVLIWWGHRRHDAVEEDRARDLVRRICAGRLALLALHSSHWSRPFMGVMEMRAILDAARALRAPGGRERSVRFQRPPRFQAPTPDGPLTPSWRLVEDGSDPPAIELHSPNCGFPVWRREGGPSRITTLLPEHPIAAGVPASFEMRETEMYSEPFHVPEPDAVIFEERWETGEHFRTGMTWQVGQGRVFYFGPGHETYDVFRQEIPLRIVMNAVRWLAQR